jgi:hypothetical protein
MTVRDFRALYEWIAVRDIIPFISVFTPMQGAGDFQKYKDSLLTRDPARQDLYHCILKPKHMSVMRFNYEYYKLSLGLFWRRRKTPLFACVNSSLFLYAFKAVFAKIRRFFIV